MSNPKWTSSMKEPKPDTFKEYVRDEKLAKLIEGKRIVFVGPGAHLNGSKSGELIDSYDIVIRAAQIFPVPKSEHKDRGSRTDITVHSFNLKQIAECKKHLDFFKTLKYVIASMVYTSEKKGHDTFFAKLREDGINTHKPTDGHLFKIFTEVGTCLNSGISGLITLLNYDVKEIYITGFNFYNMGKYGKVYYDGYFKVTTGAGVIKKEGEQMTAKSGRHDLHNQKRQIDYMRKLVKEKPELIKIDQYLKDNLYNEKSSDDTSEAGK